MSEFKQYVSLLLGAEKYGINIMDIEEILRMIEITKVPKAPSFVEGIINLRGKVIPIVDLRNKLGIMAGEYTNSTRVIVVNLSGKKIGFIVDHVEEVLSVDNRYIEGVARMPEGMVIILDVHQIFNQGESSALNMF
jgi:purine-binding chemotaxis protein CheW